MAWEPIEITEELVRAFAASASDFCESLSAAEQRMWLEIISRAGGDGGHPDMAASEPASGRYGSLDQPASGNGASGDGRNQGRCDDFARMLAGVWEPGTIVAPVYSGDMPREGGGTVD